MTLPRSTGAPATGALASGASGASGAAGPLAAPRRAALVALLVAFTHIVFGAIVRITGSGMGCQDSWPKCRHPDGQTYWFPPFDNAQILIEWTHRLLAMVLLVAVVALLVTAWRRRAVPGVGGAGGVLPAAQLALGLWVAPALFGAITVFLDNPAWATAVHKALAASLLAVLAAAVVRAGGFGATRLAAQRAGGARVSPKTARGAAVAGGLVLAAIIMGAFTAKTPDAAIACQGFPLCGEGSLGGGAQHIQLTHRLIAYALALHLVGLAFAVRARAEAPVVRQGAWLAVAAVALQVVLAVGMLHTSFTVAALRSMHQATGMLLWVLVFALWYLARGGARVPATRTAPALGGLAAGGAR